MFLLQLIRAYELSYILCERIYIVFMPKNPVFLCRNRNGFLNFSSIL